MAFHHDDHLSGANVTTGAKGEVLELADYYPYGEVRIEEKADGYQNDYLYTGQERDEETSLMYYGARYYDAKVGRFMGVDAWEGDMRDPQSLNKYAYVVNNPLKYLDPTGLSALIFAGENYDNPDNPDEFYEKAQDRADGLKDHGYYDGEVYAIKAYTTEDFQNALENYKDIELIEFYGHGDSGNLYLGTVPESELTPGNKADMEARGWDHMRYTITNEKVDTYKHSSDLLVEQLYKGNISRDLFIHLFSCNSAVAGSQSIASTFAWHFNAPTYGSLGGVKFDGYIPYSGLWKKKSNPRWNFKWMNPEP